MNQRIRSRTHRSTEDQYEAIREEVRLQVYRNLPDQMTSANGTLILKEDIKLGPIDNLAKKESTQWGANASRHVRWDWRAAVGQYAWRNPQRFELSIWHKGTFLAGLSLGRPTKTRSGFRLDFMERNPNENPMQGLIATISIVAAETYGRAIGASEIRIMNPINEKVRDFYLGNGRGYTFIQKEDYCQKRLI